MWNTNYKSFARPRGKSAAINMAKAMVAVGPDYLTKLGGEVNMKVIYCDHCGERLAYDAYARSWFCVDCELVLLLTDANLSATLTDGRSLGVLPFPRVLSVTR